MTKAGAVLLFIGIMGTAYGLVAGVLRPDEDASKWQREYSTTWREFGKIAAFVSVPLGIALLLGGAIEAASGSLPAGVLVAIAFVVLSGFGVRALLIARPSLRPAGDFWRKEGEIRFETLGRPAGLTLIAVVVLLLVVATVLGATHAS